jgi:hypothetical protein
MSFYAWHSAGEQTHTLHSHKLNNSIKQRQILTKLTYTMAENTLDDLLNGPHNQIRAVLRALCQDTGTRSRTLSYLEDLQAIDEPSSSRKRKADDELCICVQCDEAFHKSDIADNTACRYHWGKE